jgi:peroxiredoxin
MLDHTETLVMGARAPEFSLEAANRDGILTLSGFLKRGSLILEFLRGTWCPNCVQRMARVESIKNEIEQAKAELAYVAAEKRDGVFKPAKFLEKNPVSFPFMLDEDRSVTKSYGLYHRFGMDALNIAHPATLVIDPERNVRFIYRGDNQSDRAPLEQVMSTVRKLS